MGFYSGATNSVSWFPSGGAGYTELCDFRHEWSEHDEGHEVTSSCHSGVQAFIASIFRGEGTASFHIKSEQYPWNISMKAQVSGLMKFEFGNNNQFVVPVYISRVNYQNETAAGTDYNATYKLNAEAGTYSYPS